MTDDEIITVVDSHRHGKRIECQRIIEGVSGTWMTVSPNDDIPWNFGEFRYRILPEPRKPREWWIEPLKYGLCRMSEEASTCALWHVREVIE